MRYRKTYKTTSALMLIAISLLVIRAEARPTGNELFREVTPVELSSLVKALQSPRSAERIYAIQRFQELDERAAPAIPYLINLLGDLAHDRDNWKRSEFRSGIRFTHRTTPASEAAIALSRIGKQSVEPLIKALSSQNLYVRLNAVTALSEIDDDRVVQPIIALMEDTDDRVRATAVYALGHLRRPEAVDTLIKAIDDPSTSVRGPAVQSLSLINGKRAVDALIAVMYKRNSDVRSWAAEGLGRTGDVRAVMPLLAALDDERTKMAAISSLGELGDSCAVEPLIAILADQKGDLRSSAAAALGKLRDKRAVEPLLAALEQTYQYSSTSDEVSQRKEANNRSLRQNIVNALGEIGDVRVTERLIRMLSEDPPDEHWSVIRTLGKLKDLRAVEPLIAELQTNPRFSESVIQALGSLGDSRAVEPLINEVQKGNSYMPFEAVRALAKIGDAKAVPCLLDIVRDRQNPLRLVAANALEKIGGSDVAAAFEQAWDEKDLMVITGARQYFIRKGTAGSEQLLVEALYAHGEEYAAQDYIDSENDQLAKAGERLLRALKRRRTVVGFSQRDPGPKWGSAKPQ